MAQKKPEGGLKGPLLMLSEWETKNCHIFATVWDVNFKLHTFMHLVNMYQRLVLFDFVQYCRCYCTKKMKKSSS